MNFRRKKQLTKFEIFVVNNRKCVLRKKEETFDQD